MAKLICPIHGPYDASEPGCPKCRGQQGRPPAPTPLGLSADDLETEIGEGKVIMGNNYGDDPTELGKGFQESDSFMDQTDFGQVHKLDETEFEVVDQGPIGILWVTEGPRRGQIHRIKHNTVIGRSQGDILLDDPKVSSSHSKFTFEDDKFFVWDFGTRNGTFVNGERIRAATPLEENDKIKIGDFHFIVKIMP
jgi:hypothetical protein